MKITVNGTISEDALKVVLNTQKSKVKIITEFCKNEKLDGLFYKDNELEFEFQKDTKSDVIRKMKVEVRNDVKGD